MVPETCFVGVAQTNFYPLKVPIFSLLLGTKVKNKACVPTVNLKLLLCPHLVVIVNCYCSLTFK